MNIYPEKKKILIIDDESGFTEMVKLNLEATGKYLVRCENNGMRAVDAAQEYQPDLILLDIIMPETDGTDICWRIKEQEELQTVPVVFLTATVRKNEVEAQHGDIGGYAFLAKPTTVEELTECIESHLNPNS